MSFFVFPFSVSVSLNSVIAVLDADFHSLPSAQHRQHYCPVYFCELSPVAVIVIFFIVRSWGVLLFFCCFIVFQGYNITCIMDLAVDP